MNKITIIHGPQGSGKTTKALEMLKGKNYITATPSNLKFNNAIDDFIFIDGATLDDTSLIEYFCNVPGDFPDIIITSCDIVPGVLKERFNIVYIDVLKFDHLMIDIETMGNKSYSVILSIAAVEFDIKTGKTGRHFNMAIDMQTCIDSGLRVSGDTTMWWLDQTKEAQNKILTAEKFHLSKVLVDFSKFCKDQNYFVWGNSNSFDLGLLQNAYEKCFLPAPWRYTKELDVRTLVFLNPEFKQNHEWTGTAHDAVTDCLNQISYCVKTFNSLTNGNT